MSSCVWDKGELPPPSAQCDTASVTFTNEIGMIFVAKCSTCHTQSPFSGNLNVNSYAEVKERVDNGKFQALVFDSMPFSMPPAGKLPDTTLARIQLWIDAGACE